MYKTALIVVAPWSSDKPSMLCYADIRCRRLSINKQKGLKIASQCDANLFVELLDKYIYYYENDNPAIQVGG